MNPVDERFEHRLLDRFHYDDRQDGASLTLMERAHGTARWRSERGESKPIELTAPDGKPTDTVYAYQSEPDEWRIYDKYGGRSLGGEPGETITDALRHIGYQLEES